MRRWCLTAAGALALLGGCGGGDDAPDPPIITDRSLADSLGLAVNRKLDDAGVFGTRVGETGGRCSDRGRGRWVCSLSIAVNDRIRDQRTYVLQLDAKGCWTGTQTATDIGGTGTPAKPSNPDRLKDCL